MKLPPALTWMHLFERDASFACDATVPTWMRDLVVAHANDGSRVGPVRVSATDYQNCASFVGITSQVRDDELNRAGFTHIRRFAVLPDLQTARWFIPLDAPAVSSAAFSLYSPARLSARLKVAAARLATYSRLPVWYRDELVIARRAPGRIEQRIHQLVGGTELRLALSSGAPEPARNRKVSLAAIATDGSLLGFAKLAGSDLSHHLLSHESQILPELKRRGIAAPSLVFAGEIDGTFMTLQQPLPGRPVASKLSADKLTFLASLQSKQMQRASESNLVASLPKRIAALSTPRPELASALHDVLPALAQMELPSTVVHGDFAPWNLREHDGNIAAFDWEYAELDGLPLIDQTHFRVQVGYLLEKWTVAQAYAELRKARPFRAGVPSASSPGPEGPGFVCAGALVILYLIDQLVRLYGEGYDQSENEMVGWYDQLLRQVSKPSREAEAA